MKLLLLHDGSNAIVDDEDYERLSKFDWFNSGDAIRRYVYVRAPARSRRLRMTVTISLSSEVMNRQSAMFDHKDRDFRNNQKYNLRECNRSQNNSNRTKSSGTSSKYKGVYLNKNTNRWVASMKIKGKTTNLGTYDDEWTAAEVYNKKALELYKEFACLNVRQVENKTIIIERN